MQVPDYASEATMTDPVSPAVQSPDLALGAAEGAYRAAVDQARDSEWARRLFDRDVSLWSTDAEVGRTIAERLGWLDAPADASDDIPALEGFGDGIVDAGFTTAVVAGMGGSSLAPDVLYRTFGASEGYLDLRVLDSTDPAAVAAVARRPGSARDAGDRREQVGHHGRAEGVPRRRVASRRGSARPRKHHVYARPGARSSRSPTRARASRRSPTTTSSARSSSTRPTSAAGTAR